MADDIHRPYLLLVGVRRGLWLFLQERKKIRIVDRVQREWDLLKQKHGAEKRPGSNAGDGRSQPRENAERININQHNSRIRYREPDRGANGKG